MRNFLALVGAATVAFLAAGWYLGWYQISSPPSPGGESSLRVEINPGKITEDVKKGVEKGGEIVDHLRDQSQGGSKPAPGPASDFFSPTGDHSIPAGGTPRRDEPGGYFGLRVPRD
jgi:hypothetical protein